MRNRQRTAVGSAARSLTCKWNLSASPSPLIGNLSAFAAGTSQEAVEDTAENLGLAMRVNGELYPVRLTAYKSLLDRAKIGGTALPKLSREVLAEVLNKCRLRMILKRNG